MWQIFALNKSISEPFQNVFFYAIVLSKLQEEKQSIEICFYREKKPKKL